MFAQGRPQAGKNLFRADSFLQAVSKRYLPADAYLLVVPKLEILGEEILQRVKAWGDEAEKNPPKVKNFDEFGNRIDELSLPGGWQKIKQFSLLNRMVAVGYDKKLQGANRCAQAAMQIMFSAYSANYSCPLAMTDGAIKVLQVSAPTNLREKIVNAMIGKDEKSPITCGQWMTERIGGSDLKNIETHATLARKDGDAEIYRLYGLKWFASGADCEHALVLAQIAGFGPSLFLVKVWDNQKLCEGLKIDRLKDKLGTNALPTAEIRLEGALGTLIGSAGNGILTAAPLLNITRFYNALASASLMTRAFFSLLAYSKLRVTFDKPLCEHILYEQTLADLDAKRTGAIALCFEVANLLGKVEKNSATDSEKKCLRVLIPLAKLVLGKMVVSFASEALEAMGGVGYMKDSEFSQILRDAQVLPIWEGCTNILVHDVVRAQARDGAMVALLRDLCERSNSVMTDESDALRILRTRLKQISEKVIIALNKSEDGRAIYLEPFAKKACFTVGACAMALLLAEAKPFVTEADVFASNRFTTFVENNLCGHFSM